MCGMVLLSKTEVNFSKCSVNYIIFVFLQNAFSSRSNFIVHPEWLSENVDPPLSRPMNRPPWPWEQPKYRQNIKLSQLNNGSAAGNVKTDTGSEENGTGNTENVDNEGHVYAPLAKYHPSLYWYGHNAAYMDANGCLPGPM